jgi:hypothetical protein
MEPSLETKPLASGSPFLFITGLIIFFLGIIVGLLIAWFQTPQVMPPGVPPQGSLPANYEECIVYPGSVIQESYPSTCIAPNGDRFVQNITNEKPETPPAESIIEPSGSDYSCPKGGYVNCMPMLDEAGKKACSSDAMIWYRENCPDFQGAAL